MWWLKYWREHLHPEKYGIGYAGAVKQLLYEKPVYVFTVPLIFFSLLAYPYIAYRFDKLDVDRNRYTVNWTVMRCDDPRIKEYKYFVVHAPEGYQLKKF